MLHFATERTPYGLRGRPPRPYEAGFCYILLVRSIRIKNGSDGASARVVMAQIALSGDS